MNRSSRLLAQHSLLAAARESQDRENAAAADKLRLAADWCEQHVVEDVAEAALFEDSPLPIAGEGCPLVSEFAVVEFASALGLSQTTGRHYLGQALELKHRLPRAWARVMAGEVTSWRARRLAEQTTSLSVEAVEYVDRQLATFLDKVGLRQQERLVEEAVARYMPELAAQRRLDAADARHLTVDRDQVDFAGTVQLHGVLDLADAIDLDQALSGLAEQARRLGSQDSLPVRRSKAAGELGRTQLALGFDFEPAEDPCWKADDSPRLPREPVEALPRTLQPGRVHTPPRRAVLYLHLGSEGLGAVENRNGCLITPDTIREWLSGAHVTVRPLIDLNTERWTASYQATELIREQVVLTTPHCVHPGSTRDARSSDLDHIVPFDAGGPTSTTNLAPLCRLHHRVKTHGGWRYQRTAPGVYVWTSALGYRYRVDARGTTDLTPRPIRRDPPER